MEKFKVLIGNDTIPPSAAEILKTECDVIICEEDRQAILKNIPNVDAFFWSSGDIQLDKEMLERAGPNLKAIATMSAGYDNIDIEEIRKRGIKFGNTPGVVGKAVADQAVMLALAASRRLVEGRRAIESGEWTNKFNAQWLVGIEISGSTVGIVGLGSIGQAIVKRLSGFEVGKYLYYGRKERQEGKVLGAEYVSFDTLVENSDFIFVCIPLNKETRELFKYEVFSKMKRSCIFVNVGRGGLVNQTDLIRALEENLIFAAGLDVMTPEPLSPDDKLLKLPNCVLAPHLGTATWKTSNKMAELTAKNLLLALKGEHMLTPVI
ncbi:hypothetical protein WA026_001572 [Henosepilachna vigintioctopunctata]